MSRLKVRHLLTALFLGAPMALLGMAGPASAQSVGPSAPPINVDATRATVSGILVARPGGRSIPIPRRCRTAAPAANAASTQVQGVVVCSDTGKLVLLQLSPDSGIYARYWGRYRVGDLREGDRVNAWGVLQAGGMLLNPTFAVQDVDMQEADVDSQDFITDSGRRLTLDVLSSPQDSPVKGIVHAVPGGPVHVTLCNGSAGNWKDLTVGKRIDITHSLFNRRLMTYIRTTEVHLAGCS